jgi:chromosome segregation ATPase
LVQLNGELARVTSELTEIGHLKTSTTAEVREAEEQIKKLGPEIISKKEEANKVLVGLRYKTPERIEEALRKLRQQMSRQYSENEEKRLQSEIENLENSKDDLRSVGLSGIQFLA